MNRALEFSKRVAAPPEVVFSYFVDPEKYRAWQGIGAELDPREGGHYRVFFRGPDSGVRGRYLVVDPPHRVVFTWGWESPDELPPGLAEVDPDSSRVEVTLHPDGDGTLVRLRHEGLPTDEAGRIHGTYWPVYLDRLEVALAGGDPGPDPAAALYVSWREGRPLA